MTARTVSLRFSRVRCYYRPLILAAAGLLILGVFWFASRYPQLLTKARHVGQAVPSMAYSQEAFAAAADAPLWRKVLFGAFNWLRGMEVGMTFGVLFGALLHTVLRYYPLKVGRNLYLNSLKGALVGVPMGVCANCAVPTACGVTRGRGRVEVALGFLFSSPNFNPVVMVMTFTALPLAMGLTKYAALLLVILVVVPGAVAWLERGKPLDVFTDDDEGSACALRLPSVECTETFWPVFRELAVEFGKNVWRLARPTIALMLIASLLSAAVLSLVPWNDLLSEVTPLRLLLLSAVSVLMPVPIALDVMFAAQLHQEGVAGGYVMLFAMTLGTYSIIPSVYLWREVSRRLAVMLLLFFVAVGVVTALLF